MNMPNMLTAVAEIQPLWEDAMKWGHMLDSYRPILRDLMAKAADGHVTEDEPRMRMSYGKDCDLEKWFLHHIITTWYLGIYYHDKRTERVLYEDALMWDAVSDMVPAAGFSTGEYGYWENPPAAFMDTQQ